MLASHQFCPFLKRHTKSITTEPIKLIHNTLGRGGQLAARDPHAVLCVLDCDSLIRVFCVQFWSVGLWKLRCGKLRFVAGGRPHMRIIFFENDDLH